MGELEFTAWSDELGMSDIFRLGGYPQWNGKNDERKISQPYWSELCQILQYVGRKDREGKKIFKGDIFQHADTGEIGYVRYYEFRARSRRLLYLYSS